MRPKRDSSQSDCSLWQLRKTSQKKKKKGSKRDALPGSGMVLQDPLGSEAKSMWRRSKLVSVTLGQTDHRLEVFQCVRPPDRLSQSKQLVRSRLRPCETQLRSRLTTWQSWKIDEQLKCEAASDVQGRANGPDWSSSRPSSEWQCLHLVLLHTMKWGVWPCQSFSHFDGKNMDTWNWLFLAFSCCCFSLHCFVVFQKGQSTSTHTFAVWRILKIV